MMKAFFGCSHSEILNMTIPQIEAYLAKLGMVLSMRLGVPYEEKQEENEGLPKLSDVMCIANVFSPPAVTKGKPG